MGDGWRGSLDQGERADSLRTRSVMTWLPSIFSSARTELSRTTLRLTIISCRTLPPTGMDSHDLATSVLTMFGTLNLAGTDARPVGNHPVACCRKTARYGSPLMTTKPITWKFCVMKCLVGQIFNQFCLAKAMEEDQKHGGLLDYMSTCSLVLQKTFPNFLICGFPQTQRQSKNTINIQTKKSVSVGHIDCNHSQLRVWMHAQIWGIRLRCLMAVKYGQKSSGNGLVNVLPAHWK